MTQPDLFDALDKATSHALTIADSGPLTERSPEPKKKASTERVRISGTYRIGTPEEGNVVQSYLVQEAHQKERAARGIRLVALSLRELRCPGEFIRRVDQAADEKRRHAEALLAASLMQREEGPVSQDDVALSDLWALALDVATDRCVADTYAAVRFAFQAHQAESLELRSLFHDIARDDAVHAALFWDLLSWALSQLSPARARTIAVEQRKVRDALRLAVEAPLPEELHLYAGVPDSDAAHAILDALEFQLWSEAAA